MKETRTQHWLRRGRELSPRRKSDLCALYRQLGGLGGIHPVERWRKDEIITSIVEMEWSRLPEDRKAPEPPHYDPPCRTCGKGPNEHPHGHDHYYSYRSGEAPDSAWVCATCGGAREIHTSANGQCPPTGPAPERRDDNSDAEQDSTSACGRCGKSPADHIGWEQGHLFIRRMSYQTTPPAEEQPPGAGATAAPETATYVAAGYCTGCIVDHDPKECGYRPDGGDA